MASNDAGTDYDVIVLGAGAPGEHCAGALAEGGLRVAVVERERVGGECSFWACIPSKTLLRPGEAVQAARRHGARARRSTSTRRLRGVTSWSRTTPTRVVSAGWRTTASISLRGTGRLAGPGAVEVDGEALHGPSRRGRHRLRSGLSARPRTARARRSLGHPRGHRDESGPAAAPRARRRLGRRRAGPGHPSARERGDAGRGRRARAAPASPRRWARHSARPSVATASSSCSARTPPQRDATATSSCSTIDDGRELRGDRLLVATGRHPRVERPRASSRSASRPTRTGSQSTRTSARRRPVGDRRRHGHLAADPHRRVPGRGRRRQHPGRAPRRQLRGGAACHLHRSAGGGGRRHRGPLPRHGRCSRAWPGPRRTPTRTPSPMAS